MSGKFSLIHMVHTTSSKFGDPPGVNFWDGFRRPGVRYTYRSIPCSGPAPVNNIASDLPSYNNRMFGSRAPSLDGRFVLHGTYRDPTPNLAG